MDIFEKMTRFVKRVFKTSVEIFLEALNLSPNAQGYVSGSITELLLKKKMEEQYGFEVKRILEKWEGKKLTHHHGDFYFRKPESPNWYVIESKGIKSNSEKWHKLYNFGNLKRFLITHADKIPWIDANSDVDQQVTDWICRNLPKFRDEYSTTLYEFEEVRKYKSNRETEKSIAISQLQNYSRDQINEMIDERLNYLMSKVKILETHFVSGKSGISERTQATPRKDEFNIIAIDIFLRFPEHKFLYANPQNLDSSGDDPNHLQQNYIMGFVFIDDNNNSSLSITDEWYENLDDVFNTLDSEDSIDKNDMQIDNRYVQLSGNEV